jgi:RNA polymerase-binding transcription factor DksA
MRRQRDAAVRARLRTERDEVDALIEALAVEVDQIVESMSSSNNDDEHDPDGATNGYERAKAMALLRHAREQRAELDAALARVDLGTYGRCERCGGDIAPERLDALAATAVCRRCAASATG